MNKILVLLLLSSKIVFGQTVISEEAAKKVKMPEPRMTSKYQFLAKAKYYGDSVVLRWSANDAVLWQMANEKGYNIERFEIENGALKNKIQISKQLKPWTLEQWKTNCKRNDTTAAVIAQLLFGVNKDPQNPSGNGSMDAIMNQRYDMENRFFMVNMMAAWHPFHAKGLALRYVDKTIKKDKKYVYQISSAIDPKQIMADTAYLMVRTNIVEPLEKMTEVEAEAGDKKVTLKWSKLLSELNFTGYYYERSDDNGRTFTRINKKPYLQLENKEKEMNDYISVKDTLPLNYHKYLYRVAGINHFGEISQYSSNIVVTGIDLTPPAQVSFISVENTSGANVKIKWQKKLKEPDMIGFVIGRSQSIKGPFEPLQKQFLPINATEYVDNNAEPFGTNYYVVSAIDTAGNAAISLPAYAVMKDEAPPATPTGLKGSMDSTGVIKMTWNKNTEPDLEGYLVYAANQKDHVFTPITTGFLLDEFFADSTTLQTLTKYKYYKVVAFDKARKASLYSEILTVKRPDKVAPVAAVFNNYSVSDSTANISWIPSSSDDALKQILSRKEDGHAEYKEIKTFDNKTRSYFDSEVIPGHWYSYIIQTIDESGLKSEKSFPLRIKPYVTGIKPNVKQLKIVLLEDHKSVNVSWSPASNENQRVLIYRKINNGDMQLVEGINNPIKEFKDKIYAKGIYYYATKVKYNDGGESLLSEFLKTEVN